MNKSISKFNNFIRSQINYGTQFTDDTIVQKQLVKANFFYLGFSLFLIFISSYNIYNGKTDLAIAGYIDVLILISNNLLFRLLKKIKLYCFLLSFIFTIAICSALLNGAYNGSGVIGVGIVIISVMNISGTKTGTILAVSIILFEIFIFLFNSRLPWLYNYPGLIDEMFIRFIAAHIGIFSFTYISIFKQNELFLKLKSEKEEKEHLFLNLVHDIKTPLTIIHNSIDKCLYEKNNSDSKELLKSNIIRMEKNILNILNIDRFEKGLFEMEKNTTSNLSRLTLETCNMFNDYAESRGLKLTTKIKRELYVKIDRTSYMEILYNLLDNAIKYTESGGSIVVTLALEKEKVILEVKDSGIGIPDSEKDHIFEKYYQANKRFGNYYGLGIGLAFTQKICEAFNGKILCKPHSGKGSVFKVTFPNTSPAESCNYEKVKELQIPRKPGALETYDWDNNRKTILIVEDNNDILSILVDSFKQKYNLLIARNGEEGLSNFQLHQKKIVLIITDIMMPVMDGTEFIEKLKEYHTTITTPIIFLTAKSDTINALDHLSLGAVDYIKKPFSMDRLQKKVDSIINLIENRKDMMIKNLGNDLQNYITDNLKVKSKSAAKSDLLRSFSITKKEESIINEICKGHTNKEIAANQNISLNTVKTHIYRIYKKCKVKNSTSLIKLFYH